MEQNLLFNILDQVDSTNNYAMAMIHEELALHGMAWFSTNQTAGKGQRGKIWETNPGDNIALSIAIKPNRLFWESSFPFNAFIALICREFIENTIGQNVSIKWPNDLWIGDRKAVGLLIENKYRGNSWNWSVVGIGINVNQLVFSAQAKQATSLRQITGKLFDPEILAKQLHQKILSALENVNSTQLNDIIVEYNRFLYKKGKQALLIVDNNVQIETTIVAVNELGQLVTKDAVERSFTFGEVSWITDAVRNE